MAPAETKLPMSRGYPQPVQVRGILGEKRMCVQEREYGEKRMRVQETEYA